MKPRYILAFLLVLTILSSFQVERGGIPAYAQDNKSFAIGDTVLVVAYQLPVHVQPDSSSGVANELLYGMKSNVIGIEVDANGMSWYYLTELAYGWVPSIVDDQPTLIPFSDEALDEMFAETTATIDNNPEDAEAYVKLGTIHLSRREFTDSIYNYNCAVQLRPDDAALHDYLGKARLDNRDYDIAQQEFSTAIDLGRLFSNTYNRMAIALENLEEEEQAIQYYQRAIDVEPGYGLVYANMGHRIFQYRGDKSTAYDLYNQAIEIDPYLATAYVYRGDLFTDSSDLSAYPQGIEDYDRAIAIDPSSELAYAHRGVSYMWLGDWVQAESDMLQAAELDPYYEFPIWNLASMYGTMGNYEGAIDCYSRVINIWQNNHIFALLYRAQDYLMLGQYDLARQDIDTFIGYVQTWDMGSDFTITAYMVGGAVYLHLAESNSVLYPIAAEYYSFAFEADPYYAAGFYSWCQGYGVICSEEQIIEDLQSQLNADPQNADLWRTLATEYMQRGRFSEALGAYEHYQPMADSVPSELEQLITTITELTR